MRWADAPTPGPAAASRRLEAAADAGLARTSRRGPAWHQLSHQLSAGRDSDSDSTTVLRYYRRSVGVLMDQ